MKSEKAGIDTSEVEVTNISSHGIWIYIRGKEYFLPFDEFPWFKNATISQIQNLQFIDGRHLRWPEIDVDLELDSLKNPGDYPLIYKTE